MLRELRLLKRRAIRRGVWFKALSRIERSIYDLTMKVVTTIKSEKLFRIITTIVDKLRNVLESTMSILSRTIGRQLAARIARVACLWGHPEALKWASDKGFANYLAVCYMNMSEYYKARLLDVFQDTYGTRLEEP